MIPTTYPESMTTLQPLYSKLKDFHEELKHMIKANPNSSHAELA